MNVETLTIKRQEIETKFNEVKAQREKAEAEVTGFNEELTRLQGEYRAVSDLITSVESSDPASVIEVKEKGKKNAK